MTVRDNSLNLRNELTPPANATRSFSPTDLAEQAAERSALGKALEQRTDDIVHWCQAESMKKTGISKEDVNGLRWDTISVAVHSIANWLISGVPANTKDRERLASLGNVAARESAATATSTRVEGAPDAKPVPRERPQFQLSIVMLTRLNLWWSEATRQVLAEEAARLMISRATLEEDCDVVLKSCYSSLVRMAKRYDAELQSLQERLTHLAQYDSLTGLVNRRMLTECLERSLARLTRHSGGLVVAFMDLDNFKEVNDAFGHACGDDVLVELASRFTAQTRPGDVVARFGGDEFVAVFEDLSDPLKAVPTIAERLRSIVAEPVIVKGEEIRMTFSIGIAVVQGPGCLSDEVLARADEAMYSVKRTGRNKVVVVLSSAAQQNCQSPEAPINPSR